MSLVGVVWVTDSLREVTGYSEEARTLLSALDRAGVAVAARELKPPRRSAALYGALDPSHARQLATRIGVPRLVVEHHLPQPGSVPTPATATVARTMFETDRVPAEWLPVLGRRDQVWVPSSFNHATFRDSGIPARRLRVVPQVVDIEAFKRRPDSGSGDRERFRFLSVFDFSERKGSRQLLRAWCCAFGADDGVELMLKVVTVGLDLARARQRLYKVVSEAAREHGRAPAPIILRIGAPFRRSEMPALYHGADAFVSASRGEAWGRPFMEATAAGLPVIAPRYGGHLDFLRPDDSWLVGGRLVDVKPGDDLYPQYAHLYRGHRWFEVDVDELASAMRDVYERPAVAREWALRARERIEREWPAGRAVNRIVELATELSGVAPTRGTLAAQPTR